MSIVDMLFFRWLVGWLVDFLVDLFHSTFLMTAGAGRYTKP